MPQTLAMQEKQKKFLQKQRIITENLIWKKKKWKKPEEGMTKQKQAGDGNRYTAEHNR